MAYELEGINPAHSFGDEITFNVFHWPPIVDYCRTVAPNIMVKVNDWHMNDGQGLERTDAAELGRLLMLSLLDGHFERVSANFNEEDYLVRPDLLGNAMFQTEFTRLNDMTPAGAFELNRDLLLRFSMFLGVCGGFRIR